MKLILLGMAMMGTATYGSTDLFHKAQNMTDNVTAVYATAGAINHYGDVQSRIAQQEKLFAVAKDIEPFARDFSKNGEEQIAMLQR